MNRSRCVHQIGQLIFWAQAPRPLYLTLMGLAMAVAGSCLVPGCGDSKTVGKDDVPCPQVALPPDDFCPKDNKIEQYLNAAGCTDFRCVPDNCPVYQRPECPDGQHVEMVTNEEGCNEPVCVSDTCPTIAAPDATFCPGGQVLLDTAQCQWVCHGGDRCPFIGDFAKCMGTTVIESDPETHCLTGIDCLP